MPAYMARIFANVVNVKYKNGEGTAEEIIATYNLSAADAAQVLAAFYAIRQASAITYVTQPAPLP